MRRSTNWGETKFYVAPTLPDTLQAQGRFWTAVSPRARWCTSDVPGHPRISLDIPRRYQVSSPSTWNNLGLWPGISWDTWDFIEKAGTTWDIKLGDLGLLGCTWKNLGYKKTWDYSDEMLGNLGLLLRTWYKLGLSNKLNVTTPGTYNSGPGTTWAFVKVT